MRFKPQMTERGLTLFDAEAGETFKSRHSAGREAEEVFFRPAYLESPWRNKARPFRILELGFGLGTNFLHLAEVNAPVELLSVERDLAGARYYLAECPAPALAEILTRRRYQSDSFIAELAEGDFFAELPRLKATNSLFHAVYFDPFSPKANPQAWTTELFALCHALLHPAGRLVTYSVSRAAKDAAAAAGFTVEKRALPPELQKRSALLAVKPGEPLK